MTTTVVEACGIMPPPSPASVLTYAEENDEMTTLTIPCRESISSFESVVSSWSSASAAANAGSQPLATHQPIPYSFPLSFSFPMTTPTPEVITKNLVLATAPFNFSVPAVTATENWSGEVRNVTVVPVSVGAEGSGGKGGGAQVGVMKSEAGRGGKGAQMQMGMEKLGRIGGGACFGVVFVGVGVVVKDVTSLQGLVVETETRRDERDWDVLHNSSGESGELEPWHLLGGLSLGEGEEEMHTYDLKRCDL